MSPSIEIHISPGTEIHMSPGTEIMKNRTLIDNINQPSSMNDLPGTGECLDTDMDYVTRNYHPPINQDEIDCFGILCIC